jgi:hypothetical protein
VRHKQVSIDGQDFMIASLNLEQTEEIVGKIESGDIAKGKARVFSIIRYGLNNYIEDKQTGESPWTEDDIRKRLDLISLPFLKDQILSFSGLLQENPEPGETKTAQKTESL